MTKTEFKDGLRTALTGELPDAEIENNIRFYDDYIRTKSVGNNEEDIVGQLGEPRLIAKTIIDTYQITHGPIYNGSKHEGAYQDAHTTDGNAYEDDRSNYDNKSKDYERGFKVQIHSSLTWYQKLLIVIIAIILISLFLIIGRVLFQLFFRIGIPLIVVYLGYRLITDNLKR